MSTTPREQAVMTAVNALAAMDHARLTRAIRHLEGEHLAALMAALRTAGRADVAELVGE